MAFTVNLNNQNFSVPEPGDVGYALQVTNYLKALASAFPQLGSSQVQALTAEWNAGSTFGITLPYVRSSIANPSAVGFARLAKTDSVGWRNQANSADLLLAKDTSDALLFGGQNVTGNPFLGANTATGQSIPNGVTTIVVFGTVETDSDSAYNATTGRYTVPAGKGGQYVIASNVAYQGALFTTTQMAIFTNAVEMKRAQIVSSLTGATQSVAATLVLAAGDIIDIRVNQNSGGAVTLVTTAALNYLTIKRLTS
jgi:C1q domain